jgi:hypothetical protein
LEYSKKNGNISQTVCTNPKIIFGNLQMLARSAYPNNINSIFLLNMKLEATKTQTRVYIFIKSDIFMEIWHFSIAALQKGSLWYP